MPTISSIWPGKPTTKYSPLATTIQPPPSTNRTADAVSQAKRARSGVPGGLARHRMAELAAAQSRHARANT